MCLCTIFNSVITLRLVPSLFSSGVQHHYSRTPTGKKLKPQPCCQISFCPKWTYMAPRPSTRDQAMKCFPGSKIKALENT